MIRHRIAAGRLIATLGVALLLCILSLTGAFAGMISASPPVPSPSIDLSPLTAEALSGLFLQIILLGWLFVRLKSISIWVLGKACPGEATLFFPKHASHSWVFAAVVTLIIALPAIAFADTAVAAPPVPSIDLSPLLGQMIEIAIAVFGPAAGAGLLAIVLRVYQLLGIKTSDARNAAIRATVDHTLDKAIGYARNRYGHAGPLNIDVGDPRIAVAAEYALDAIPDTLKDLGIVDAASDRLAAMVQARLSLPAAAGAGA